MSFILDAIKKSDKERQKNKQSGGAHLQSARVQSYKKKTGVSRAIVLVLALLLITFVVWLIKPFIQLPSIVLQQEEPVKNELSTQVKEPDSVAASDSSIRIDQPASRVTPISANAELPPRNEIKELWELPADFQQTVPKLEFSLHIYSDNPQDSTIIINGRRVRTGQQIISGMYLHLITETGVIVSFKNRFFHIEVIEEW